MNHLDAMAENLGTKRREDETDNELHVRLRSRHARFFVKQGTFYDLVHVAEQAMLREMPVGADLFMVRREVGIEMFCKNRPEKIWPRIRFAFRAVLAILF